MEKIKILHFEISDSVGGIESFLVNLYTCIDREEFQFDFITQSDFPAKGDELQKLGGKIYKISTVKNPFKYIYDICKILDKGYDLVHIHKNSLANILQLIAVKICRKKIKIVLHSHNTAPTKGKITYFFHKLNINYGYYNSNYHLACSEVAGKWMYSNKNFTVVKNGIIAKDYLFSQEKKEQVRKDLFIPKNAFVIGHVGRFSLQKNHEKLINIFNEIYLQDRNSYLILIGEGNLKESIVQLVKKLHLEKNVFFLGIRKDIPNLLNAMDVFLMPSFYEGLPVSAIEAQASGLNVVLSKNISEQTEITDGVMWFSIDDENEKIAKLVILNKNVLECERINRNKQVIDKGYDMRTTSCYISELYKKLIEV